MNLLHFWNRVTETSKGLAEKGLEEVWLMSLDNQDKGTHGGAVSIVSRDVAARRLVETTHRIATAEEVKLNKEAEDIRLERDRKREIRRDPRRVILAENINQFGGGAIGQQGTMQGTIGQPLAKAK